MTSRFTYADLARAKAYLDKPFIRGGPLDSSIAQLIADVRAEERQRCAAKCDELASLYDAESPGQVTCLELAKILRSGA